MATQEGTHFNFRKLEFWAERGMITLVDTELCADSTILPQKAIRRLTASEFFKRALAICAPIWQPGHFYYPSEARELVTLLENAATAVKQAKAQGDPSDPAVRAHHAKHSRKSSSILVPGTPSQPAVRYTVKPESPRKILWDGAEIVPDLSIPVGNAGEALAVAISAGS